MKENILQEIHAKFSKLTKAERKIANTVLDNPEQVVYMSISGLAEASGVGDTSVHRFCRTLGKKGYQDFKMSLAQTLASGSEEAAAVQMTGNIGFQDNLGTMVHKVLSTNIAALNDTYRLIHLEDISTAVNWMVAANSIHFFGVGASMVTALEAQSRFMRITGKVHMTVDVHLQAMSAALLGPDDLAIAFSYSGETKDMLDIVNRAHQHGAKVIGVTHFSRSPLGNVCDLRLLCGANEGPMQGGSTSVKMSQLFLLDVLYTEYFRRTRSISMDNRTATADAVADKLY